jgi:hypothetical protein
MKEHTLLFTAMHKLKIDVPVMRYEIKGDPLNPTAITLHLYGGRLSPTPQLQKPRCAPCPPHAQRRSKCTH